VNNVQNAEMDEKVRFRTAKNQALKEFLCQHNYCWSPRLCWEWPKYKTQAGYGTIIFDGFKFAVHRLSFEHYKGVIPKGMVVMHACDNPPCFNPDHLFLGTHAENMQDMIRKGRHKAQRL